MNHMVAFCRWSRLWPKGAEVRIERAVLGVVLQKRADLVEEGHHRTPAVLGEFPADQIKRLDAISALVNHGDTGIADKLLHAPFGYIAVPAEHLLRPALRSRTRGPVEDTFQDRG
jgi:hypothetical protein